MSEKITMTDSQQVGKWAKAQYGPKGAVTAIFMTHAVVNNNCDVGLWMYGFNSS